MAESQEKRTRGRTQGIYLKNSVVDDHERLKGRRFYVERTAPDGSVYRDIYEVPMHISAFVRDSVGFTIDIMANWQEVPNPKNKKD